MRGRVADPIFCGKGHLREGNTGPSGHCRVCDKERAKSKRDAIASGIFVPRKAEKGFCLHGHVKTEESCYKNGRCKECAKEVSRKYNKDNQKEISEKKRNRPQDQKDRDNKRSRDWILSHLDYKKASDQAYRVSHREEKRLRHNKRMKSDVQYKLACHLRWRMNRAIHLGSKSGSAVSDLGCSIEELKCHIEGKFLEGMTWENWGLGKDKWNIDHKIPLISFDLENREQFLAACNFKNLQPLWSDDNIRKGASLSS